MTLVDNGLVFGFEDNSMALHSDAPVAVSWAARTLPPFMPLVASPASRQVVARFHDDYPVMDDREWGEAQPLFLGRNAVSRSGDGWRELIDTGTQTQYRIAANRVTCWYGRPSRFLLHEPARLVREMLVGQARRAGWCRLHAAAVEVNGLVTLILGGAGAGKSSTVAQLLAAGASFVANDRLLATGIARESPHVVGLPVAVRWGEAQLSLFAGGRGWIDDHEKHSSLRRSDDKAGYRKYELTVAEVAALTASVPVPRGRLSAVVVADRRLDSGRILSALTAAELRSELEECKLEDDPAFPSFYDLEPPDRDASEQTFEWLSKSINGLPSFRFCARFDDTSAVEALLAEIAQTSPNNEPRTEG